MQLYKPQMSKYLSKQKQTDKGVPHTAQQDFSDLKHILKFRLTENTVIPLETRVANQLMTTLKTTVMLENEGKPLSTETVTNQMVDFEF